MFEWLVHFERMSDQSCIPCDELASLEPFLEVYYNLDDEPDEEEYRPHDTCICGISSELSEYSDIDGVVGDLFVGSSWVEDEDENIEDTWTNASYADTLDVTLDTNREEEVSTEETCSFEFEQELDDFSASLGGSFSFSTSSSSAESSSTEHTLEPRTGIQIIRMSVRTTTEVFGIIYDADTHEPVDESPILAGFVHIDEEYNIFGDTFDM
jgi:hypothetical protein